MNYTLSTALTVLALAGSITAASAQSMTVTGSVSGSTPLFTYSYVVAPVGISLNDIIFNFSDNSVLTGVATGPVAFTVTSLGNGVFQFLNPLVALTPANASGETFSFTAAEGPGGTLGTVGVSLAPGTSAVVAFNGTAGQPIAPAPEPSALVSMAVLGTCLGLGVVARRRKMSTN